MLIVLSYFTGDQEQALTLANWIRELGPYPNHKILIAHDRYTDHATNTEIKQILQESFGETGTLVIRNAPIGWPEGANAAFKETARYIEYKIKMPWLWFEPDTVPLTKDWLDTVEKEWRESRKPFWGAFIPAIHGSVDHLSGVAVYPGELVNYAGEYYWATDTPFDLVGARQAVPQSAFTKRIQHRWCRIGQEKGKQPLPDNFRFTSYEHFREVVTEEAVIFHGDKTLSLINILRPILFPDKTVEYVSSAVTPNYREMLSAFENVVTAVIPHSTNKNAVARRTGAGNGIVALADGKQPDGCEVSPLPPVDPSKPVAAVSGFPAGTHQLLSMNDVRLNVEALGKYASDGFARMRVIRELRRVNLIPRNEVKENELQKRPIKNRKKRRRKQKAGRRDAGSSHTAGKPSSTPEEPQLKPGKKIRLKRGRASTVHAQ